MKKQPTEGENTIANYLPNKQFISKLYKELMQLSRKKKKRIILSFKKGRGTEHFPKDTEMPNKYMKSALHHYSSGKCKTKLQ